MRNSQLKPGYNVQIGVDADYVVGIDISSERFNQLTLIPFLEKLNEGLPKKFINVVADAGYASKGIYLYLGKNHQNSFIKPQAYDGMKKASFKKNISKREYMEFNVKNDEYTFHNKNRLRPTSYGIKLHICSGITPRVIARSKSV